MFFLQQVHTFFLLRQTVKWSSLPSSHFTKNEVSIKFLADLVTFTEEILNGKLNFSCSVSAILLLQSYGMIGSIVIICYVNWE